MTIDELKKQYIKAQKAYYNTGSAIMTDAEFDKLENKIRKLDPKWSKLKKTGIAVDAKKTKIALIHYMPSLNKLYPADLAGWIKKYHSVGRWLVMHKEDGGSLQLTYRRGKPFSLVTRGTGVVGGDISFLIPFLKIPDSIPLTSEVVLRIEAVIKTKTYQSKWANEFDNPRNMVNGLLNRRDAHPALKDVDLIVLGVYGFTMYMGLSKAKDWGFKVVPHTIVTDLYAIQKNFAAIKAKSLYAIDGLVIAPPDTDMLFKDADRPNWMTAYKENIDTASAVECKVTKIIWQTSPHGKLIPKARIEPTRIGDVIVTNVTLNNAAWMQERPLVKSKSAGVSPAVQFPGRKLMIGPGAIIKVIRSGDVIPKIVAVLKAGKFQPPKVEYVQEGLHFVEAHSSAESDTRMIGRFFTYLGVDHIASKGIETCYKNGLTRSLQYLNLWANESSQSLVDAGLGQAIAEKVYLELDRVLNNGLTIKQLMVCSGCFGAGLGDRKLEAIIKNNKSIPDVLRVIVNMKEKKAIEALLLTTPGWEQKTVDLFMRGLPEFRKWLKRALHYINIANPPTPIKTKGYLSGETIVFTRYRSDEHKAFIETNGGKVSDSFNSEVTIVLYKEGAPESSSMIKARKQGIPLMTFKELEKKKVKK